MSYVKNISPIVKKYIYKSLNYNLSKDFLHLILSIDFLTFNLVSVFTSDAGCVRNLHQSSKFNVHYDYVLNNHNYWMKNF